MTARLVTIPFSHFCEKARWALERAQVPFHEEPYLPLLHVAAVRRLGGKRTVPALRDGARLISDSTALLHFADEHCDEPSKLFPIEPALAAEVAAWEELFDLELGPATRRMAYFHLLADRTRTRSLMRAVVPRWQSLFMAAGLPAAVALMRRGMRIDAEGYRRSKSKLDDVFARVEQTLSDGRRYLCGDRFTAAELTFASLAAPLLAPPAYERFGLVLDGVPPALRALIEETRDTVAGRFGMRLYAEHRGDPAAHS